MMCIRMVGRHIPRCICLWGVLMLSVPVMVWGNKVEVWGNVLVDQQKMVGNVAVIELTVQWENSWRDDYNYDAVYFFLKYRKGDSGPWYHAYLMNDGHDVGKDYAWTLAKGNDGKNQGIFVQRAKNGSGPSKVSMKLKWDVTTNPKCPLKSENFNPGIAETIKFAGMLVEMVYIPRGPFRMGDTLSTRTLRRNRTPFPAEYNLITPGRYFVASTSNYPAYPPENAVNQVNDITNSATNAWVGNGGTNQNWRIDFCSGPDGDVPAGGGGKKTIQYIAIAGLPGRTPANWKLLATNSYETADWHHVYPGENDVAGERWDTTLLQVYPPLKAIKVTAPAAYCHYLLQIDSMAPSSSTPVIKTIAMTDKDLSLLTDYSVLVDAPVTVMNEDDGMSARDGDNWQGTTPSAFPNGYPGFYVMKYEISQEQYVEFLNKLPYAAQKNRTIGDALDELGRSEEKGNLPFIFSQNKTRPAVRNGIVLVNRGENEGDPVLFGCDLNADGVNAQDGDGQCIACNFLTIDDMLAYADWAGLRPLTEMEYEKMSRRPYPERPLPGEFAWNTKTTVFPSKIENEGTKSEAADKGNVNAASVMSGPLRCGIFAKEGDQKQESCGASFWGVMDLSGNLAEMYYNVNTDGRSFNGVHGTGELNEDGSSTRQAYWPSKVSAIAVRGGSFKSPLARLATSDREFHAGYFRTVTDRDSTIGFRLGHSAQMTGLSSILTLPDGRTTSAGTVYDTLCSGQDYKLVGNKEVEGAAYYTYLWYVSENDGKTWTLMENEKGKDLNLKALKNTGMADHMRKKFWYKRKVVTPEGEGVSGVVAISVIDDTYTLNRMRDTVTIWNETNGIEVVTKNQTVFEWSVPSIGRKLTATNEGEKYSQLYPYRENFMDENTKNLFGEKIIELKMTIANRCVRTEAIEIHFPDATDKNIIGIKLTEDGYRCWDDGTYARSADDYRVPKVKGVLPVANGSSALAAVDEDEPMETPYKYVGKTGSGIYRIDPDGEGPIEPFDVYCDMETAGGGWMLVAKFSNADARRWCADKGYWTRSNETFGSFMDETTGGDAKSKVWGSCPVNFMMFKTRSNIRKAFYTTTPVSNQTMAQFFTKMLAGFPNTSRRDCEMTLNIKLTNNAVVSDFPWINVNGFQAGQITIAKYDGSDTQGVISGYARTDGEADYGLGSLEDARFSSSGSQADVGYGTTSPNTSTAYEVFMFVK